LLKKYTSRPWPITAGAGKASMMLQPRSHSSSRRSVLVVPGIGRSPVMGSSCPNFLLSESAMGLVLKLFSFSTGTVLALLGAVAWLCSHAMPKCIHREDSYSFPRTVDGKTTRTCYKCGHTRGYDMTTMRFVTGHFVSRP